MECEMNMYAKEAKCVVAVLANGKPLKEGYDGIVEIPENSEYVLRFKNKNTVDVLVKFTIDGEDASGRGYVLLAGETADIERFSDVARKFKFVGKESSAAILDGKNNNVTPGMIEVKFYYRAVKPATTTIIHEYRYWDNWPLSPYPRKYYSYPYYYGDNMICGSSSSQYGNLLSNSKGMCSMNNVSTTSLSPTYGTINELLGETNGSETFLINETGVNSNSNLGVTVEGDKSSQTFSSTYFEIGALAAEVKLILRKKNSVTIALNNDNIAPLLSSPEINEEDQVLLNLKEELLKLQKLKQLSDEKEKILQEIKKLKSELK